MAYSQSAQNSNILRGYNSGSFGGLKKMDLMKDIRETV
jgi:hypothetical protein